MKLVINELAIRAHLNSPLVLAELKRRSDAVAVAAGDGHVVDVSTGKHRAHAAVITATAEAMVAEATNQTLTSAIDAARR